MRGLIFAVGVGVNIVVSRALGPEGRGQYALATLSALTIVALGKLGLEHTNVYLLGTARIAPDRLASQNLALALAVGLPGAGLLLLAPTTLPAVFGNVRTTDIAIAAATVPFLLHAQLAGGLQNLTDLITWQFRAALAGTAAQLAIVGVVLLVERLDVTSALTAYLVASIVTWAFIAKRGSSLRPRLDRALLARTLRYSLIVHVGLVLLFFQTRITLFLVQGLMGTTALGQYSLAVSLAESVLLAADSLAIALLPRQTQATIEAAASMGLRAARVGGLLALTAGAPLALFGSALIVFVFGGQFEASYVPLLALLPGTVFLAIQRFCGVPALRANRPGRIAMIYAIGVVLNVVLALVLIPRAGLFGAGASTSCSYLVTCLLFVHWAESLKRTGVDGLSRDDRRSAEQSEMHIR